MKWDVVLIPSPGAYLKHILPYIHYLLLPSPFVQRSYLTYIIYIYLLLPSPFVQRSYLIYIYLLLPSPFVQRSYLTYIIYIYLLLPSPFVQRSYLILIHLPLTPFAFRPTVISYMHLPRTPFAFRPTDTVTVHAGMRRARYGDPGTRDLLKLSPLDAAPLPAGR